MGKTPAQIKAEIKKLQDQLESANRKEAERIAGYAMKAGLHELGLSRDEWVTIFSAIATERKQTNQSQEAVSENDPVPPVSSSPQLESADGQ